MIVLSQGKHNLFSNAYFYEVNVHEDHMLRCLELAQYGLGKVSPNPMVGAVLVYDNRIIGEGYHKGFGLPHAEPDCLASVDDLDEMLICQSTLYVSLEPCDHYGKTPPCTDLIIQKKIPRVVIASLDPNNKVNGRGIQKLRDAGIEVISGILSKEVDELNRRFITNQKLARPYIILKWAMSQDGYIGSEDVRVKISNQWTDHLVHKWRSEEDGIMVGANTAIVDDPILTNRLWPGKSPVRILMDPGLRVPSYSRIFNNDASTIVINRIREGKESGVEYCRVEAEDLLDGSLEKLFEIGVGSILVEGGAILLNAFLKRGIWDEARVITNKKLNLKSGLRAPELKGGQVSGSYQFADDEIRIIRNRVS